MSDNLKFFSGPFADNKKKAGMIFEGRTLYKELAFPVRKGEPKIFDFWYKSLYYGRLNRNKEAVFLSETNLKQLPNEEETLFAIDFVVDAYNDFVEFYDKQKILGKISQTGFYYEFKPQRAWLSVNKLHHEYMSRIYNIFVTIFLQDFRRADKIRSFKDFVVFFLEMIKEQAPNMPITRTGYLLSRYCSPMVTGLIVELDSASHAEDRDKRIKHIEDVNFDVFRYIARKYGFSVDKNAPWRLVANIGTPEMQKYMEEYGLSRKPKTETDLFDVYYYKSYFQDIDLLRQYLMQYYNAFVIAYPFAKQVSLEGADTTVFTTSRRDPITKEVFKDQFDDLFWLKTYYQIRMLESNKKWDHNKKVREIRKALKLKTTIDNEAAICYINDQTKPKLK